MSLDTLNNERTRRALSQGRGIDSIIFILMAGAAIGVVVVLLIAGLQTAEQQAKRGSAEVRSNPSQTLPEIGAN